MKKILCALTVRLLPMLIALILVVEAALACSAPYMLRSGLKVTLRLLAGSETK